jgi:hypothetical protein
MHGAVPKTSSRVAACNHKEVKFIHHKVRRASHGLTGVFTFKE